MPEFEQHKFDKTNAIIAFGVFLFSFVVYALTVQKVFSFWDCGEFIACSAILGIPHPPGTPLFVLIGRVFSLIPFVEDISYRINYISVITSAFTAMFSYLLIVKMVKHFFAQDDHNPLNRVIGYVGGVVGSLLVAFGRTNWANSVEAEVYGMALAISVMIVWLTVQFFEEQGKKSATQKMVMVFYLALLGVGIHMTVFLVIPICALYFIFKDETTIRDWLIICGFIIVELLMVMLFSNTSEGAMMFKIFSAIVALVVLALLYKKINWAMVIAIGTVSTVMISFSLFIKVFPVALLLLLGIAFMSKTRQWHLNWKPALAVLLVGLIGLSVHLFIPIRSSHNPRIDENNPDRDFRTFVDYLDRKQYGQTSMTDRMFNRRGAWENQLGRHPHMGFWSYFEEQYSPGGWLFIFPYFALGLFGLYTLIRRRLKIGLPFLTLLLATSVGLVLYMNFADGTKYNFFTTDAYLEVRNRDYFFTPAFVFFGVAMGLGVSAVMNFLKEHFANNQGMQKIAVYACTVLIILPGVSLAKNYHSNDRSVDRTPYVYAKNILDSCEENAILFTAGDNDTFPVWCIQEAYGYRKDVTVVNLSLLNTDWYVYQMKHMYDVPISLTDEQILWHPVEINGIETDQPNEKFHDRPRKRYTYMKPNAFGGRLVKVQDMMVDEIVIENRWQRPIYFSSPPYAESPLKLVDRARAEGIVFRLTRDTLPASERVNTDRGYDLFMNVYDYEGYASSEVYRDENATGVFISVGVNSIRLYDALLREGDTTRAVALMEKMTTVYPEYYQLSLFLSEQYRAQGDSVKAEEVLTRVRDSLSVFIETNPENLFYRQDLGLLKIQQGLETNDIALQEEGKKLVIDAFYDNPNSSYAFRKALTALSQMNQFREIQQIANDHAEYLINLQDQYVQQITGKRPPTSFQGGP